MSHEPEPARPEFSVSTLERSAMEASLRAVLPHVDKFDDLLRYAGRPVEVVVLDLATSFFAYENELEGKIKVPGRLFRVMPEIALMLAMVPASEHRRMRQISRVVARQIG